MHRTSYLTQAKGTVLVVVVVGGGTLVDERARPVQTTSTSPHSLCVLTPHKTILQLSVSTNTNNNK
jgi:hypothetical protein